MSCGADTVANDLMDSLTEGEDFEIPDIDLSGPEFEIPGGADGPMYDPIPALTEAQLTTRVVGGEGMFDGLMASYSAHIKDQYSKGLITGAEYTKAYIALATSALSGAVSYLLGKDQAYWQAQIAQIGAVTARVNLETAKVQLATAQLEALNQKAQFSLTKMKLATEDMTYCTGKFNLEQIMPQQLLNLQEQNSLIQEQKESQRAQTLDIRSDGAAVTGVLGKQKLLYAQQTTSYIRDAEVKAAKIFSDAWITQKTMDEGLVAPPAFTNASVDVVMENIKTNNNLD
ncbi:MAG: hypothetical protein WC117_00060 [Sphaerochaetaceae bacterium]|jgi:hypothetical protein